MLRLQQANSHDNHILFKQGHTYFSVFLHDRIPFPHFFASQFIGSFSVYLQGGKTETTKMGGGGGGGEGKERDVRKDTLSACILLRGVSIGLCFSSIEPSFLPRLTRTLSLVDPSPLRRLDMATLPSNG